jgi:hypothetical protein
VPSEGGAWRGVVGVADGEKRPGEEPGVLLAVFKVRSIVECEGECRHVRRGGFRELVLCERASAAC